MAATPTKLDNWIIHNKNVLFIGKHGVGKTAIVKDAFLRHKLNFRYFSASTMDPWVDFVGVPREKTDNKLPEQFEIIKELGAISPELAYEWVTNNWKMNAESAKKIVNHAMCRQEGLTYLDLVRPKSFANGEVEAIFFDEFNRSPKKVRNAVMELLQFKSINGFKFPNLRMIWAAINPDTDDDDETYDVEPLDPAQQDRFHISVKVDYEPNTEWFREEYGQRVADSAVQWWQELDKANKSLVSPRRLQYALDVFRERGDMRDVLPNNSNISKLITALNTGPVTEKLENLMKSKDISESRAYLSIENNYTSAMKYITKSSTLIDYFLPLLKTEKLGAIMAEDDKLCRHIINNADKIPIFQSVCKSILDACTNQVLVKKIRKSLTDNEALAQSFNSTVAIQEAAPHFNKAKTGVKSWSSVLADLTAAPKTNAAERNAIYDKIVKSIPEKMTADEALKNLELLNELFVTPGGTAGSMGKVPPLSSFSSQYVGKPFEQLMGIVNHSIAELHRNTGLDWSGIIYKHGSHFKGLLEKIKLSGLETKLHMPRN